MRFQLAKTGSCLLIILFLSSLHYNTFAQTIQLPDPTDCSPEITALDCGGATFNNTEYTAGEEYRGSLMVPYTGGNGGIHPSVSIASTGVTGITADLLAGALNSGAGNLIFYVHGTPSGPGVASFEITYGGQTCTASLTLTEITSNGSASGYATSSCAALHNPKQIASAHNGRLFLDQQGYLWIQSEVSDLDADGTHLWLVTTNVAQKADIPERLKGPYYGTPQEITFDSIIDMATDNPLTIIAVDTNGDTWAFGRKYIALGTRAPSPNGASGYVFCDRCPNSSHESDDGVYGWGRLTNINGDNIVGAVKPPNSRIYMLLDENGDVWATANTNLISYSSASTSNYEKHAGLPGGYVQAAGGPSHLQVTIPNDEAIVKIVSYHDGIANQILALSETGKLYGWGYHSETPIERQFPVSTITALDIEAHQQGVWIKGSDNKLYSIGYNGVHRNLGSVSLPSQSIAVRFIIEEATGWTNLNVDLEYIPTAGDFSIGVYAFVGVDGKLYVYQNSGASTYRQNTTTPTPYENLIGHSNLDYSSGVRSFHYSPTGAVYIHTNTVLATTGNPYNLRLSGNRRYRGTVFPNVDYVPWCYPYIEQYDGPLTQTGHHQEQIISAPAGY